MEKLTKFLESDNGKIAVIFAGIVLLLLVLRAISPKSININLGGGTGTTGVRHLWSSGKPNK